MDIASWAAGLLGDDALMIQLALILQQQQYFSRPSNLVLTVDDTIPWE